MSKATVEEQGFLGRQTEEANDEQGGRFRGQLWWTRVAAAGLKATPRVGEDPYMRLRSAFPLFFHSIPPTPLLLDASKLSTVTGMGVLGVAILVIVIVFDA